MRDADRPPRGSLPPAGTRVYRGEHDNTGGKTVGIHWSTDPAVARPFSKMGNSGEAHEVEITDPAKQVIPYGVLRSAYYIKGENRVHSGSLSGMQGFPSEQEVRLRPGATFQSNGRNVTIDNSKGHIVYPNLHEYAATPEAANEEWFHATNQLGHVQTSMFDDVVDDGGNVKGHVKALGLYEGNIIHRADAQTTDVEAFGTKQITDDWSVPTHSAREGSQYIPPRHAQAPHAVKTSPQFKNYADTPLPGM